ncbi:hypothetical protein [Lysobacter sp. FW306-1B-D06B]|nr:hypothetical protein [Lysobacter sp. MMG2]
MQCKRRPMAAVILCALSMPVFAADPVGHDPAQSAVLAATPVHVVLLNTTLKSQVPYQYYSVSGDPTLYNPMFYNVPPGMSAGQAAAAGVAGGLIAGVLINASMQAAAKNQIEPADAILRGGGCNLDQGAALSTTVADAVRDTAWGKATTITAHTLAPKQSMDKIVDKEQPRYVLSTSYSMSSDFSAIVTSVSASAYAEQLPGSPKNWRKNPAWTDDLVVVSDRVEIAPKTQADIDAAIAEENARYEALNVNELIVKANGGDRVARGKVAPLVQEHKRKLRAAAAPAWTPIDEAVQRSRIWTAEGCARLHTAIASNATEMRGLLGNLFRGELPARVTEMPKNPQVAPATGERRVQAEPIGVYRLTRAGDNVNLAFRYSWLPESEEKEDGGAGEAGASR